MAITATNSGGSNYDPVASGTYAARCVSMIHIGTVKETYNGDEKMVNKVRITWELPTEKKVFKEDEGEKPYTVSKTFTLSMHEKANLRKFLQSWRGKAFTEEEAKSFDVTKLLGVACTLSVTHGVSKDNGNTYAEITSVSPVMKGMVVPPQINPSFEFNYEPFIQSKFDNLPTYLKDKMYESLEYKAATNMATETPVAAAQDPSVFNPEAMDDLPF